MLRTGEIIRHTTKASNHKQSYQLIEQKKEDNIMIKSFITQKKVKFPLTLRKLFDKAKLLLVCIIFAFIWNTAWNTIPVTAQVTDNISNSIQLLLGAKNAQVTGSYEDAVTNAKINYLESQITALKEDLQTLQTVLDSK